MKRIIVLISVALFIILINGCSNIIDVAGTWAGVITQTEPETTAGPIELTITQEKEDLEGEVNIGLGTYILDFTGTIDGDHITGTCVSVENEEEITEIDATVEGDEMTGTWENTSGASGTFEVVRD